MHQIMMEANESACLHVAIKAFTETVLMLHELIQYSDILFFTYPNLLGSWSQYEGSATV